jgi:hypothetical protein
MSLLNTTNDGLPNVLAAICGTLFLAKGALPETELMAKVAPEEVVYEKGKMVRQTLNRWVDLGLFSRIDGKVSLSTYFPPMYALKNADTGLVIRRAVRACALADENNPALWAKEGARAADLTRSLCLLLVQDVYRTGFAQMEERENEQVVNAELRLVQNDTRVSGLKKWAHFLGFVRLPDGGDIDPTVAVRESVEDWMPRGETMLTTAFLARLAQALPVLDGGVYRTAIEEKLNRQKLFIPGTGEVSSSLSRALLTLRATGELAFENRSDAEGGLALTGRDGVRPDLRFTHVTRAKENV